MFSAPLVNSAVSSYLVSMAPYIALAALALSLLAVLFLLIVSRRVEKISLGSHGSLEKTLDGFGSNIKELQTFRKELEVYLKTAEARLHSSVRGVGVVRFNAFTGGHGGGNQSFAIALLDETLSGVVFSALYTRERVGVYAKPLHKGVSTFTLTEEEEEAVEKAKAQLTK